jgi:hypothetical protein
VSGTINLTASASDNVGVTNVQFLVDGSNYGALDTVAPYSVSLNTGALTNGSHTVQARARDAAGNVRTSSLVTFNVSNVTAADTTPPNVAVTSPTSGQTVSGTINAAATASDNVGVAGVRFLIDGAQQGSEDTAAPYTASINTTALTNGNHTITARARDAAGNVRTSTAVTFAVSNSSSGTDSTPPNVTLTSPANGSTISGLVVATASATDNVRVVGVQFLIDGKAYGAEDRAAPFNATIHTSLLTTGAHTIAATARDAAGNRRTAQVSVNVSNSTFTTLRLNTGGSDWRDATGNTWLADAGYVGGTIYRTGAQISGENEPLYKDQRNGSPSFRYNFYVPNGTYRVKLGFAEINWMISGPGQRLFHVHINGARVLTYFDVWAVSGGNNYHHDVVIPVTVGNGTIQISFDSAKSDAIVSAIQIERQ